MTNTLWDTLTQSERDSLAAALDAVYGVARRQWLMGLPLARGVYDYLNEADRTGASGPAPAQVYNAGGWRIALYRSGPFGTFRVVARRVEDNNYDA